MSGLCSVAGALNVWIHELLRFKGGAQRKSRQARCLSEEFKGNFKAMFVFLNVTPELHPFAPH